MALATLVGCSGEEPTRETGAWEPSGTTQAASSSGGDAGSGGNATSSTTSPGSDDSDDNAEGPASDDTTTTGGEPYDCEEIGYTGLCEGDVLVWCEDGQIQMADCAQMGEVCGYQSDDVGYNCLPGGGGGFGYPVGDKTTWPAGGWTVTQVLGHYLNAGSFVGGHLAQDIAAGEAATANAPVYSVADGTVLYAGTNGSTYVNVVLIEHAHPDGGTICSFYGHLGSVTVSAGDVVTRGQQVATVLDWAAHFGGANSHLHYVLLSSDLCAASDAANGALICGYDDTPGPNGIEDLDSEPFSYTSVGDPCGDHNYPDAFVSPSQFIDVHHF